MKHILFLLMVVAGNGYTQTLHAEDVAQPSPSATVTAATVSRVTTTRSGQGNTETIQVISAPVVAILESQAQDLPAPVKVDEADFAQTMQILTQQLAQLNHAADFAELLEPARNFSAYLGQAQLLIPKSSADAEKWSQAIRKLRYAAAALENTIAENHWAQAQAQLLLLTQRYHELITEK